MPRRPRIPRPVRQNVSRSTRYRDLAVMNDPILDHAQEYYRLRALREDLLFDDEISVDDEELFVDARQALELKLLLAERRLVSTRPVSPRDRKSTRLNSSHSCATRMPFSACKKK